MAALNPLQFLRGNAEINSPAGVGRSTAWRRVLLWQIPVLVALILTFTSSAGLFSIANGLFFDFVTTREPGRAPRVVIVEPDRAFEASGEGRHGILAAAALRAGASRVGFGYDPRADFYGIPAGDRVIVARQVVRVPGKTVWRLASGAPAGAVRYAADIVAPAEYGIYRSQLRAVPGESGPIAVFETTLAGKRNFGTPFLVRMPANQNIPRITASQLIGGDIDPSVIRGLIVLVAPPPGFRSMQLPTAANPWQVNAHTAEFSAHAVQNMQDGREVRRLPNWPAAVLILSVAVVFAALFIRFAGDRLALTLTASTALVLAVLAVLALTFGNVLLPVAELVLAPLIIAPLVRNRMREDQERYLQRFVTRAVGFSSRRVLLKDQTRLPSFLVTSARLIGVRRMLLLQVEADGALNPLAAIDASPDDLSPDADLRAAMFRSARLSRKPLEASALVPGWGAGARIAGLGMAGRGVYWLYSLAGSPERRVGERMAMALAFSYREAQRWRSKLGVRPVPGKRMRSVEGWIGSAVNQIADQGEQLYQGIDALDTGVMIYHFIGYPLQANARMVELYQAAGLSLSDTTLATAIEQLTELDGEAIARMLHHLLFHGGEMRVPCRSVDAKSRILRVAVPEQLAGGRGRAIVLEAIDISEIKQLGELRLAVANFIDSQLRNDLGAIGIAAAMGANPKLDKDALLRTLGQIDRVAQRATGRLAEIVELTHGDRGPVLGEAYPINARAILAEAMARVAGLAGDLDVKLETELPELSGMVVAAPGPLAAMVEAMLRLVIADEPQGGKVRLTMAEESLRTRLTVSGGIGTSFERLYAALDAPPEQAPPQFRAISEGISAAMRWGAVVTYSSSIGGGYRFVIEMRRIG